jgi:hypothetical protein
LVLNGSFSFHKNNNKKSPFEKYNPYLICIQPSFSKIQKSYLAYKNKILGVLVFPYKKIYICMHFKFNKSIYWIHENLVTISITDKILIHEN